MPLTFRILSQIILAMTFYFVITSAVGIWIARRDGRRLADQEVHTGTDVPFETPFELFIIIPCLNEAKVIGETVRRLLGACDGTVVLVDDGSSDGTGNLSRSAASDCGHADRLRVVTRSGPESRHGKGPALNAALPVVVDDVSRRGLDPSQVIVLVMDADGRLSDGAFRTALEPFDNPRVGAVQLIVRIRNRRRLIAQFQDIEFWLMSAMQQFARTISGTVGLGGNGQFTRLNALLEVGDAPWSTSLTEDLHLGLRLVEAGWTCTTTTKGYVDQQAVDNFRGLLRQRTRWAQGTMTCIKQLPAIWRSPKLSSLAVSEVTAILLIPWLIVLPWSILQQWALFNFLFGWGNQVFVGPVGHLPTRAAWGILWYCLSFLPYLLVGLVYSRRTREISVWRAVALGNLFVVWNYVGYLAAWRALSRIIRGRSGWDKTPRSREPRSSSVPKPAAELQPRRGAAHRGAQLPDVV